MYKIRTFNQISDRGLDRFAPDRYSVGSEIADPHGILLRSHELATSELAASVRAVARAGAGVNNVPVEACTQRGVVVFNTPGANANSVKELVLVALLIAARDVVGGIQYVTTLADVKDEAELNRLIEAEKQRFKGRELYGKSLGVVGLGAIGSLVARAALDLGMDVIGFDPAISVDAAWRLPSEVQRMENLPSLFARADFVTLHVPLLAETQGLINDASLRSFRPGSVLLNFARQPIVDTAALKRALDDGTVSRYIADFPVPGLTNDPRVHLTPHLGASTDEAEENCAVMAANQLISFLETGNITNSVNFPKVSLEPSGGYRLAVTNRNVPGMLGQMTSVLAERGINVIDMLNKSRDDVAYNLLDVASEPVPELIEELCAIDSVINVRVLNDIS
ncbi:MAG: phosphoglycerate dehydrogenase [Gammaproteobacteria bacterium]|nr:phosphoglycerate dehydrogenase [Gammaproteobacteria bacterium]